MLQFSPSPPYVTSFRLAACMLLLGLDIGARFVGPVAVVRCSETLLQFHPISEAIRSFGNKCTSLDAFLGLVAAPSDKHGSHLFATPIWRESGLRYQSPSLRASVGQLLLSAIIGLMLPLAMPGWNSNYIQYNPLAQMVVKATCVLTLLAHLFVSALDGTSHELDPKRYQSVNLGDIVSFRQMPWLFSTFAAVVFVPVLAVAVVLRSQEEEYGDEYAIPYNDMRSSISLAFMALVVTFTLNCYLILVNEAAKVILSIPGINIPSIVSHFSDSAFTQDALIVCLESILQGNDMLVASVLQPLYLHDQEVNRGNEKSMTRTLLFVDRHALVPADSRLESDTLCMLIMEMLGGQEQQGTANADIDILSPRHEIFIKNLAQNTVFMGGAQREPDAIPLVRALCAYAGGLGEALVIVSLPPNAPQRLAFSNGGNMATSWIFPPGARACGEWAIRGAARLIVYSLKTSAAGVPAAAANWCSSSLSILIPLVIQAAFVLRKGTLRFARTSHRHYDKHAGAIVGDGDMERLSGENKVLLPIVVACEESVLLVVKALLSIDGGTTKVILPPSLSAECQVWLETLL